MFSMLVFVCRDPGDTASKVSCVETSYCFKYRDFDAIAKVPIALPLKIRFTRKRGKKCLFRCNYAFTRRFDLGTFTKKA